MQESKKELSGRKLTREQQAAFAALEADDIVASVDTEKLIDDVNVRREQMRRQMQNPPKSKVQFRLSDVDEDVVLEDNVLHDSEEVIIDEEVILDEGNEEVILDEESTQLQYNKHTRVIDHPQPHSISDVSAAVEAAVSNKMNPLLQMQTDAPLFEGLPGYSGSSRQDNLETEHIPQPVKLRPRPILSDDLNHQKALAEIAAKAAIEAEKKKKEDAVKFKTPTGDPPPVDALVALTYHQREELLQKMYIKAKNNVMATADKDTDKNTINEAIRREMDRLLELYKSTH
jgi:hypothetical protein